MRVRSVYTLKSFGSLEEAIAYAKKIHSGAGTHSDSQLEIEFDKTAKKLVSLRAPKSFASMMAPSPPEEESDEGLQWKVVVVNEDPIPGGTPCAECDQPHFEEDFLCPDCRAAL